MTSGERIDRAATHLQDAIGSFANSLAGMDGAALGEGLIQLRESADRIEAAFADGLRRFDKSGEYAADGALNIVAWLLCRIFSRSSKSPIGCNSRSAPCIVCCRVASSRGGRSGGSGDFARRNSITGWMGGSG